MSSQAVTRLIPALALLALLGVSYVREKDLRERYEDLLKDQRERDSGGEGSVIERRRLSTMDGGVVTIGRGTAPTVVTFFSPSCPHCNEAAAHWAMDATNLGTEGTRSLLVSTTDAGAAAFLERHGLSIPTIADVDGALARLFD